VKDKANPISIVINMKRMKEIYELKRANQK
jgi:hypothetical protein